MSSDHEENHIMRYILSHILICAYLFTTNAAAHDDPAKAHYLGNEGVLITHGQTKILFDAFYANSYGQYALVPDDISAAMMSGTPPFDGVDAIFVSHVHGDHFTAAPAIAYLRVHESVQLYGSQQVYDAILSAGVATVDPLMARIHGLDLAPEDEAESFAVGALSVDVVAIPHSGNRGGADSSWSWPDPSVAGSAAGWARATAGLACVTVAGSGSGGKLYLARRVFWAPRTALREFSGM